MPLDLTGDKSAFVHVMDKCQQAIWTMLTKIYMSPYDIY